MDKNTILKIVAEQNVRFIRLQFTDILGVMKASPLPTISWRKPWMAN